MNYKISIILPIYNVEKYLRQCLDSIVNQTFKDLEIICINDCSPDNSLNILNEYAQKDARLIIKNLEKNVGLGGARNIGLSIATGKYVMFVDTDDWLELDACEKLFNNMELNDSDICFFNYNFYNEDTKAISYNPNKLKIYTLYADANGKVDLGKIKYPYILSSEVWYKIYKNEYLTKNSLKMLSGRNFEDVIFSKRSLIYTNNISVIDTPLYNYRKNNKSSITNNSKYYSDFIRSRTAAFNEIIQETSNSNFINAYCVENYESWLYWYKKFTTANNKIKKDFYNALRKTIINTYEIADMNYFIKYCDYFRFYAILICPNYLLYNFFDKFIFKLFHVKNSLFYREYRFLLIKHIKRLTNEKNI